MFNLFTACNYALHTAFYACFHFQIHRYIWSTVVPLISLMLFVITCTCILGPHHLIMHTCTCYARHLALLYVLAGLRLTTLDSHVQILETGLWWPCCSRSECGSTVVIYIPTEKYKYLVITESDTILQEYYITRKYNSTSYEEVYKSWEVLTNNKKSLENQTGEELGGRAAATIQASVALRSSRKDLLRTLISYSKVTKVRSLGSEHENLGLSDATLRVHIMKPIGVHNRYTCTWSSDVVQVCGTSNNK